MGKLKDLAGNQYGRLYVKGISKFEKRENGGPVYFWLCKCDCGNFTEVRSADLRNGKSTSCGCRQREYSVLPRPVQKLAKTPEYNSWKAMRSRCNNPRNKDYHLYGGRGISVCERWISFKYFLEDMGPRPKGCTLDRKDSSKGYESSNCRWASYQVQTDNRNLKRKTVVNA